MGVHVVVLCDDLGDLAVTSGDLDAQTLPLSGFRVTYLVPELGEADRARVEDLVSRRPNLGLSRVGSAGWGPAVQEVVSGSASDHALVLESGAGLYPEALVRLSGLAHGHDAVVARRVGQPTWGGEGKRGPVAAVLAAGPLVATLPVVSPQDHGSPVRWLEKWHDALLGAATSVAALEEYPALTPAEDQSDSGDVRVERSSAAWDGGELELEAMVAVSGSDAGLGLVVRGPRAIEHPLPTRVETSDGRSLLSSRLDVATAARGGPLADGDWTVGVVASAPGSSAWAPLPRTKLKPALVGGRPVVPSLQADGLELQVGRVRRRYFRPVPEGAVITESVAGVELRLPVTGPHAARTDEREELSGHLFLGGLKIPAALRYDDVGITLHAWLSGLAGRYPMSVQLGHVQRVPLGLVLVVDGVGAMSLEPTAAKTSGDSAAVSDHPLRRVRRMVPDPVVQGLRRVPALRKWYSGRTR